MSDINKIINNESLTKEEKFKIVNNEPVNIEVLSYLSNKFKNLTIEIVGKYEGDIINLMRKHLLEGWCWQTTETAIMFLEDEDYIERGNLIFERYDEKITYNYFHSWICFKYKDEEYVFDPCLNLLCRKELYHKVFEVEVKTKINAKTIRKVLIQNIKNPKTKQIQMSESSRKAEEFMKKYFGNILKENKNEITIDDSDEIDAPFFRNNTGYRAVIEDKKIKKLIAHYYYNA